MNDRGTSHCADNVSRVSSFIRQMSPQTFFKNNLSHLNVNTDHLSAVVFLDPVLPKVLRGYPCLVLLNEGIFQLPKVLSKLRVLLVLFS